MLYWYQQVRQLTYNRRETTMNTYTTDHLFFAEDGSWGNAQGIQIFDTSKWSEQDFEQLDNCSDDERISIAEQINNKYNTEGEQQ